MILFLQDYAAYPSAIVDWKTSNESALRLAELYRRMGVKNYAFHLTLMQPELQGVDPFDPNLDLVMKNKIAVECRYNPWYFMREVTRVPAKASQYPQRLRLNRGNVAMFWLFFNHAIFCLIQPRQTGKSLSSDSLTNLLFHIQCFNSYFTLLTKDDTLRVTNVERLKELRDLLPPYLNPTSKTDADNKMGLTCVRHNNRLNTVVSQKSENDANKLGRGLTAPINVVDEGPFVDFLDVVVPAMLSSGNAAREEARQAGAPYGTIFTTTAGKLDTRSGEYMHRLLTGGLTWSEHLFDLNNEEQLHDVLNKAAGDGTRMPIVNLTLSHRQLGISDEQHMKNMRETGSTGEAADRDYFNRWTRGSAQSPLPTALNELIGESKMEAKHIEITRDNYLMRWYVPSGQIDRLMAERKTVLGLDLSDMIGRDATTLVLMDVETLEVYAAAKINEGNLIRMSAWVADFMIKYKNVTMIPERRGSGQTFIDTLLIRLPAAGIDPFRRIYNQIVDEPEQFREIYKEIQQDIGRRSASFYEGVKKYFGFVTSGSGKFSREALYSDTLLQAAKLGGRCAHDEDLIREITGLMVKNNRIDHSSSGNDDMVIAWMLGVWLLTRGKNLKYYGIEKVLTLVKEWTEQEADTEFDPYAEVKRFEQIKLRKDIEALFTELKACKDEYEIRKMEARIKILDAQLTEQFDSNASIDALIKEASGQRNKRVRDEMRNRGGFESPVNRLYESRFSRFRN